MTLANYFTIMHKLINWKRDKDQTDLNEGVRNSQADRDKAIAGKATIFVGRPALVSG